MKGLTAKRDLIVDTFKSNYQSRISREQYAWRELYHQVLSYAESVESVLTREAKGKRPNAEIKQEVDLEIQSLKDNLVDLIGTGFPASKRYQEIMSDWIQNTLVVPNSTRTSIQSQTFDLDKTEAYVFKTYEMDDGVDVTILEEDNAMSNEEATTGLITWQGAVCLYRWLVTQSEYMIPAGSRIVELGSGAGLLGVSLLKSLHNKLDSYVFTDVNTNVLNMILANLDINIGPMTSQELLRDRRPRLESWLVQGPPQLMTSDRYNQKITFECKERTTAVCVNNLDWTEYSAQDLKDLGDYDFIIGSDLAYAPVLLPPLSRLIRDLLLAKRSKAKAFIACTHRNSECVPRFLEELERHDLEQKTVYRTTFGPSDGVMICHEPLRSVSIYEVSLSTNSS